LGCDSYISYYSYKSSYDSYDSIYVQDKEKKYGDFIPWTPLQYCSALENRKEMVSLLLENGADPSIKDKTGRTALDIAILLKRTETVKVFETALKEKEFVPINTNKKISVLQLVKDGNHEELGNILLNNQGKVDLDEIDSYKWTPLHWACYYNHFKSCFLLLQHGANPKISGGNWGTPKDVASYYKNTCVGIFESIDLIRVQHAKKKENLIKEKSKDLNIVEIKKLLESKERKVFNQDKEIENEKKFFSTPFDYDKEVKKILNESQYENYLFFKDKKDELLKDPKYNNEKWIAISGKKIIESAESQFKLTSKLLKMKDEIKDIYIAHLTEKEKKPIFIGVNWDLTSRDRISIPPNQGILSIISPQMIFAQNVSATIDTGADISTISEAVAESLDLKYCYLPTVFGIGGPSIQRQYSVNFSFTFEKNPDIIGVFESDAIVFYKTLIGMDVLNKMNFKYSMDTPNFEMSLITNDFSFIK